ncbi:MAG: UvrB/UvrC motif-containing protein, partial [Dehalococcoidia bacterium]
ADKETDSMRSAIDETDRRRTLQEAFNVEHGIEPEGIRKAIRDITQSIREAAEPRAAYEVRRDMPKDELARVIKSLGVEMKEAARALEFERAALLRDEMTELKKLLVAQEVVERGMRTESEQAPYEAKKRGRRRR